MMHNNKTIVIEPIPSTATSIYIKQMIAMKTQIPIDCQRLVAGGCQMYSDVCIEKYYKEKNLDVEKQESKTCGEDNEHNDDSFERKTCYLVISLEYYQILKEISNEISFEMFDGEYNYKHFNNYCHMTNYNDSNQNTLTNLSYLFTKPKYHNKQNYNVPIIIPLSINEIKTLKCGDFIYFRKSSQEQFEDAIVIECGQFQIKLQFVKDLVMSYNNTINVDLNEFVQTEYFASIRNRWYEKKFLFGKEFEFVQKKSKLSETNMLLKRHRLHQILRDYFGNDVCTILLQYIDLHQCLVRFNSHSLEQIQNAQKDTLSLKAQQHGDDGNAALIANDEHWWSFMQLSHPLSLKRNNIFLLRFCNCDCNKLKYKMTNKNNDHNNNIGKFQFEFGIACFERSSIPLAKSEIINRKPYTFMPYRYSHGDRGDIYQTATIRFDSVYTRCSIEQSIKTSSGQRKMGKDILTHMEYEMVYKQLLKSKYNSQNGIYLKFENEVYDSKLYKLSFLIKDMDTGKYTKISEKTAQAIIDIETYECFVIIAGPVCDCKGRFGFEYTVQRIE